MYLFRPVVVGETSTFVFPDDAPWLSAILKPGKAWYPTLMSAAPQVPS